MNARDYLDILHIAERLKDTPRHCTTSRRRTESVAEHCWRTAFMAYLLRREFPEADISRVIDMCLIHDLGECFTGDIPVFAKTANDRAREDALLHEWVSAMPSEVAGDISQLLAEMEAQQSVEAKLFKALDKLEALIQHNESPLDTWEEHEYDLSRSYAHDSVAFSEWLTEVRQAVLAETNEKISSECPYRLEEYTPSFEPQLFAFLEECMPESGRVLELDGRHSYYRNVYERFKGFWCLFSGGKMIGTVAVKELSETSCELKSLYMLKKYHGRGYGTAMLTHALKFARESGYSQMYLDSMSTSTRALRLYRRFGFTETERYNSNWHSDVFMVLDLKAT